MYFPLWNIICFISIYYSNFTNFGYTIVLQFISIQVTMTSQLENIGLWLVFAPELELLLLYLYWLWL